MPANTQDFIRYLLESQLKFGFGWRNRPKAARCLYHSHDSFELVYHVRGRGMFLGEDGIEIPFNEKAVIIHPPKSRHGQLSVLPAEDACIQFMTPSHLNDALGAYLHIPILEEPGIVGEILSLTDAPAPITPLEQAAGNYRISAILARLLSIIASKPEQTVRKPDHSSAAFEYIRENFSEIANLEQVAVEIGIGYDYLRHIFIEKYGKSMKQTLIEIRLDHSKRLLSQTPLPLKAIADLCGYSNDRNFCTAFKKVTGKTPGEFRRHG